MIRIALTRGIFLIPGIVSLLCAHPALLQAKEVSLQQAVELAVRNNAELRTFREEMGLREAGRARAGTLPNPVLELDAETGLLTGNSEENSLSIGISQEFQLAGKRGKRLDLADRELEVYRWQLSDRERLLRYEVKSSFYEVLLAAGRLKLAEGAIELNRHLHGIAQERLAAGDIPELELNLVKVELARSLGARASAADALAASRARLSAVMGAPAAETISAAGSLEEGAAVAKTSADLVRLALERRPDLKALQAEGAKGDAEMALARAEGIPNLTAGLALKRETTSVEVAGLEGKDTGYLVGVKLSMPIPLFDKNQAGMREAAVRRESAGNRLAAAANGVEREVMAASVALRSAEEVLSLYRRDIMPQFRENLKLVQEAYQLGELPLLTVFEEQKKYLDVNQGYLGALYERQLALLKLEAAVATDLTGGVQ